MRKSFAKQKNDTSKNQENSATSSKEKVFVFYNSPSGIVFDLGNKKIEIKGAPLSELYSPSGGRLSQGKFGISEILYEDWEAIEKMYGEMKIFKSSLIYASRSKNYGKDKAKDQAEQLNGNEQVKIASTYTMPENT